MDQTLWSRFLEYFDDVGSLITVNLIWFVLSIPVVTLIPATGGLYYATNLLAQGRNAGIGEVWYGFRQHFWLSWRWGLMNVLVYGLLVINGWFYSQLSAEWAVLLPPAMLVLIATWSLVQIYTFPLLLEQADATLATALRNALVVILRRPLPSFGYFIAIAAIIFITTFYATIAWAIVSAAWVLYLSNIATRAAIKEIVK